MGEDFRRLSIILGGLCVIAWALVLGFLAITDAITYRQRLNHELMTREQNTIVFNKYVQGSNHSLSRTKEESVTSKESDQHPWRFAKISIWSMIIFCILFLFLRLIGTRIFKPDVPRSSQKILATVKRTRNRWDS